MKNEINNLKQKSGEMKNKNEKLEQELSNLRDQMKKLKIVSNLFFSNTFNIFLRSKKQYSNARPFSYRGSALPIKL